MKTFHSNTGVKLGVNPFLDEHAKPIPAIGGGFVMVIPFKVSDEVPDKARLILKCDSPDLDVKTSSLFSEFKDKNIIVSEILENHPKFPKSKYAYFAN